MSDDGGRKAYDGGFNSSNIIMADDVDFSKSIFGRKAYDLLKESEALCNFSEAPPVDDEYKNVFDYLEYSNIQPPVGVRFEDLNLSPELLAVLYMEMKFERPSKIQSMSLPMILNPPYRNLIAQAPIYSGKTTCAVLGMLSRIDPTLPAPQALCICSTSNLAIQSMEMVMKMGEFTGITSDLCLPPPDRSKPNYIPVSKRPPVTAQLIIGTAGTVYQFIADKKLAVSNLKILVFEEAEHVGGSNGDAVRVTEEVVEGSPNCQVLLFSATFNASAKDFVSTLEGYLFLPEFHRLFVNKEQVFLDSVKQFKVNLQNEPSKITVIKDKLLKLGDGVLQAIIFVRAIKSAEMLREALVQYGYGVTTITGAPSLRDKDKMVKEFKDGLTQILISAYYIPREFDQSQVNLVVNYDLPVLSYTQEPDYEAYLRRVAKAGRFGRKGAVFNLLSDDTDSMMMEKIETHFNHNVVTQVPSWTNDEDFKDAFKKAGLMCHQGH